MNNDDTAGDLAAILFNALFTDPPVTFECAVSGLFVYTTALDNGFTVTACLNAITGEYIACYNNGINYDSTEFLAAAIFHKLADMHARQKRLPAKVYTPNAISIIYGGRNLSNRQDAAD